MTRPVMPPRRPVGGRVDLRLTAAVLVAFATVCVAYPLLGSSMSAGAAVSPSATSIVGSAATVVPGVADLGPASASAPLHIDVGVKLRDPAALSAFIAAVSTPTSPDYRHYLAKGQFGPRFGPTASTVAAVRAALTRSGLQVGALDDGMLLPVTTTVAGAERAFGVTMGSFRLGSGKVVNANTTAVHLPSSIASDIQGVTGLDNLVQLEPLGLGAASSSPPPATGPGPNLAPDQPSACRGGVRSVGRRRHRPGL